MRAALYLRRSTGESLQPDSLDAQEELLRRYAEEHDFDVGPIFRDSASGRSMRRRSGFQELITAVVTGTDDFCAILVRDVSRWGRFKNVDEAAYWEFFFVGRGINVIYVQESFADADPAYAGLHKHLRRASAADYSADKARQVQYGKYRTVRAGFYVGGQPPFGMIRVLVDERGNVVQQLKPGDHKVLASQHVRLAHGSPQDVSTVVWMYKQYSLGKLSTAGIAKRLNKRKVPGPGGRPFQQSSVWKTLTNPAYGGIASGLFRASANFPESIHVTTPGAWPAVVPKKLFDQVQERLRRHWWHRSPEGLAAQLRELFQRWGVIDDPRALGEHGCATNQTFLRYFAGGKDEAIQVAYRKEIEAAWDRVCAAISARLPAERRGQTLLLYGQVRLGYKVAFPRSHHMGRVNWRFVFDGKEPHDVTIGIAMGPAANVLMYFKFAIKLWKKTKKRYIAPTERSRTTALRERSLERLVEGFVRDLGRYNSDANTQFLALVQGRPFVNTFAVSRELGWSEAKAGGIYRRLKRAGVTLPPLYKQPGRRLSLICDVCGDTRTLRIAEAMSHQSSLCATCFRVEQSKDTHYRICVDCGDRRYVSPYEIRRTGIPKRCRACNVTRSRESIQRRAI